MFGVGRSDSGSWILEPIQDRGGVAGLIALDRTIRDSVCGSNDHYFFGRILISLDRRSTILDRHFQSINHDPTINLGWIEKKKNIGKSGSN